MPAPAPRAPNRTLVALAALAFATVAADAEVRDEVLSRAPELREVVFAVRKPGPDGHWYANFSYYAADDNRVTYLPGGRLCKLDLTTGTVTTLIDDPTGGIRDPMPNHDATRIVFSWRKGGSGHFNLYECDTDGGNLRQLTDGPWDDIEPCHLPDGGIVFVSSRCKRWVNCWLTQVAVLYRCEADGSGIRPISANIEHDNTPAVLPDGRIIYQRWEYIDRSQVHYHHLWTSNPDGTNTMPYFGNLVPDTVMIGPRPIPGTDRIICVFSPGHGQNEHMGRVTVVEPNLGPDEGQAVRTIHPDAAMRDPWPLAADAFLVARRGELLAMNGAGAIQALCTLPEADRAAGFWLHEPRPLLPRPREAVIPDRTHPERATGTLILSDVLNGRRMDGVKPGEIRKLLVLESLPKPINYTGGMDPLTYGGSFTLERVVGTVPVEEDGSAYFELPALRSFFFVALDENDMAVKRMQSFLTVQPGEVVGCAGCHEHRTTSVHPIPHTLAMRRPPSRVQPVEGVPEVLDFPRDIQPILDRHCVPCHGYEKTARGGPIAGNLVLTGDRGPMFSHAYFTLTVTGAFSDGRNRPASNLPPRAIGSSASRILSMANGSHHDAKLSPQELKTLRLWIESAAPYPGTYASLGCGMIGGYEENHQVHTDHNWPTTQAAAAVIDQRCASCHSGDPLPPIPRTLSDERGTCFWRPPVPNRVHLTSRHIVFNLTRPEQSLALLAPLAREAGGFQLCGKPGDPAPVLASKDDPAYQAILAMIAAGQRDLDSRTRFDMPHFKPRPAYIREMKRYGILPPDLPDSAPIDPYDTDRRYWESLWHAPQ